MVQGLEATVEKHGYVGLDNQSLVHLDLSFIHSGYFYSISSSLLLLRGAPG